MMREKIILTARTWIGTPHRHQGRMKYVAVDCVGLIIGIAEETLIATLTPDERKRLCRYRKVPDANQIKFALDKYLEVVGVGQEQPGDIAWMAWKNNFGMHAGILTEEGEVPTIIHSDSIHGCVVEKKIPPRGFPKILGYFKYKGVDG